jgi:hypothetical protein
MTPYENALSQKQHNVLMALRPVLLAARQPEPDIREFTITQSSIREFPRYSALSRAILDADMPEVSAQPVSTTIRRTEASKVSWQASSFILPRSPPAFPGELDTFAIAHNLHGYIDWRARSPPN